ncbi:MAG: hypothetical protein IKK41_03215 [Oscillospiraceae bacterium]|nr:hypothetical protein [Oscillospiraceae bacterium]
MKRNFLLFLMIAVLIFSTFVGCGDSNTDTEPETTNATQAPTNDTFFGEETEDTLPNVDTLTLPEFNKMTAEQQQAVMNTFETTDEFFEWYDEIVQHYEDYVEQQKNPTEDTTNNETTETTVPNVSVPPADKMTYVVYNAMSADEQLAFINSFESIDAFFVWYNTAKEEYNNNLIEIDGSTPIDLEEVIGSN